MELGGRSFLKMESVVESKPTGPGFEGAWFEARILRPPRNPDSKLKTDRLTLVEFQALVADDESRPLAENVDARLVRPPPPLSEQADFKEGDAVEGSYAEGWWTGTVKEVRDGGRRYRVEFDDPPDEAELGREELRVRWDWHWAGCHWVKPPRFQEATARAGKSSLHGDDHSSALQSANSPHTSKKLMVSGDFSLAKRHSTVFEDGVSDAAPLCALITSPVAERETSDREEPRKGEAANDELETPGPWERVAKPVTPVTASPHKQGGQRWKLKIYHRRAKRTSTPKRKREKSSSVGSKHALVPACPPHSATKMPEAGYLQIDSRGQHGMVVQAQPLPFTGSSPIWETVDSPEAFQKFPHNPQPVINLELVSYEESDSIVASMNQACPPCSDSATQMPEAGYLQIDSGEQNGTVVQAQPLPFIRISPIWETVESLEAFQKFPQNPHFGPLGCCNEKSREGMAIACMVNFASTVEKIFKLNNTDPMSSFKDCLETLVDLEPHGFDIEAVETHLRKLLKIKEGREKLQERSKESENLILELIQENAKIDEDMERLQARKKVNEARMSTLRRSVDAMNIMAQQWPQVDLKNF
ncbi:hypothetical protein CRG98_007908 [Punica granatum]|uniref:Agenet domain-containing protein n=1 Tax=Punica granatum TaxID=22663 RepID=A0A2I0KV01_PUNGR|nr:hypothetical protein CRG98_007908 [Punica granatum]